MDIKDLNKAQLLMLALLLSFVTSIATGIVTVTLMQQAPDSVVTPINRIVRQTVEKIVQVPGNNTVQTVVIKEEDLVVDAIDKNRNASFTVTRDGFNEEGQTIEISAGRAFVINKDGLLVADNTLLSSGQTIYVKNESGKFKAEYVSSGNEGFAFLKIGAPLKESDKLAFTVPAFGNISTMKTGQKILMLGSSITSFMYDGNPELKNAVSRSSAGSMVVNLNGQVLGVALYKENNSFVKTETILEAIKTTEAKNLEAKNTAQAGSAL